MRLTIVAIVSFWIARQLGPDHFGVLNFASALAAILVSISTMGMETPVVLRLVHTHEAGKVLGSVLALRVVAAIVATCFGMLLVFVLKGDDGLSLSVALVVQLSVLMSAAVIFDYWFKASTSAFKPAMARISGTLLSSIAKAACLSLGFGVLALAWTVVLEAVLISLGLSLAYFAIARGHVDRRLAVDRSLILPLARESMPYLYSTAAVILYMKVDVVMLGYLSSDMQTGIYSLAQKLSEILYIVPIVLIDSTCPALVRRYGRSEPSGAQVLFDLATAGSILVTLVSNLLAGATIRVAFGDQYEESIAIFYLHSWSCVAIALSTARDRWLAVVGLQRYTPFLTGIGLVANIAINLVLIPRFGAVGAAVATVMSYLLSGYLSSFLISDLSEIGQMQTRSLWPWARLYKRAKQVCMARRAS